MRFHDVCLIVSDLDRSIKMWTELFDFKVDAQFVASDDPVDGDADAMFPKLMRDIWGMKGIRTKLALLSSPGGAALELQEPITPAIRRLPKEYTTYNTTGIHEVCFYVENIDEWFKKVKNHGYRVQTEYVWPVSANARTFLFYDDDGHLIQLWETSDNSVW
jgi:catechol 2,3-dioxygenase-like lactoylglutathione lyase family enzyme